MADQCTCPLTIRVLGDGCRYCQPQTYIDHLEIQAKEDEESMVALMVTRIRLSAQLRECAETLGADQIDEQRAMRAYVASKYGEEVPNE